MLVGHISGRAGLASLVLTEFDDACDMVEAAHKGERDEADQQHNVDRNEATRNERDAEQLLDIPWADEGVDERVVAATFVCEPLRWSGTGRLRRACLVNLHGLMLGFLALVLTHGGRNELPARASRSTSRTTVNVMEGRTRTPPEPA